MSTWTVSGLQAIQLTMTVEGITCLLSKLAPALVDNRIIPSYYTTRSRYTDGETISFTSTEAYNTAYGDSVSILNCDTSPPTLFLSPKFEDHQYERMSIIKAEEYEEEKGDACKSWPISRTGGIFS